MTYVKSSALLLVIAYLGFISLGFPDPVAGVAWPTVRHDFKLAQSEFGLILLGLGFGYCVSGFFGGKLSQRFGLGNLLWGSSAVVALAMLLKGVAPSWTIFLTASVIWGLGSGGIDAGLNHFVSQKFSARHMNWLHACYSLGATFGPLLMTLCIVYSESWRTGYVIISAVLLGMAFLFAITRESWNLPQSATSEGSTSPVTFTQALVHPIVILQVLIFLVYVGLEFTVGQWCYTFLTESAGAAPKLAGLVTGGYYGAIGAGRIVTGTITEWVPLETILRVSMLIVVCGTTLLCLPTPLWVSSAAMLLIGLGLAAIFPCLMSCTPRRLSPGFANHAIGFQVSFGMLGAALIPALAGVFAEKLGLENLVYFILLTSLLMVALHEAILKISATQKHQTSEGA